MATLSAVTYHEVVDPLGLRHAIMIGPAGACGWENLAHVVHESIGGHEVRNQLARQVLGAIQQGVAEIRTPHGTFHVQPRSSA